MDQYPTKIETVKFTHQEQPIQPPGLQAEGLLLTLTYWPKT